MSALCYSNSKRACLFTSLHPSMVLVLIQRLLHGTSMDQMVREIACLWDGVECRLGHVIGLDLSSSFLYGPISSNNSLFNLIHLRTLNLANNDFRSSQIPSAIGRLSQLINLNMSNSFFSGEVQKQISHLRNLVSLDLTENYKLTLQGSDFQNLVQNTSETLRELGVF
ncbi:putative leucine-rich repeat domain superfamily [Helianthus debilis subsp. tardiflorus]